MGEDFYPRSPCGERLCNQLLFDTLELISIHALLAESDRKRTSGSYKDRQFLSTLSLRRATICNVPQQHKVVISIHALLAESDRNGGDTEPGLRDFYPRSPCGERLVTTRCGGKAAYFYPRSPCGERRGPVKTRLECIYISIHALLAESDQSHLVPHALE